jgi:hypothetical protein
MVRRSSRYRVPASEKPDRAAILKTAIRELSRKAGLLVAYRRFTGLHVAAVRTLQAQSRLDELIAHFLSECPSNVTIPTAMERAARIARTAYDGEWWVCTPTDIPPAWLGEGDEYISREQVRVIVEGGVSAFDLPTWR